MKSECNSTTPSYFQPEEINEVPTRQKHRRKTAAGVLSAVRQEKN